MMVIRKEYLFKFLKLSTFWFFQKPRIIFYSSISVPNNSKKLFVRNQPLLIYGLGKIKIGKSIFGVQQSPYFFSTYSYIEARNKEAEVIIGNNTVINNALVIIANIGKISIGDNVLIGSNVQIYDSDFHNIPHEKRHDSHLFSEDVNINNNVFIGSNVTILKGVTIGYNSVIASGSLVVKSIPNNVVAAGNPCRVIKEI